MNLNKGRNGKMTTQQIASIIIPVHKMLQEHYGKDYSFPSQKKVLELIKKMFGFTISRATLCRWYKRLKDDGHMLYIRRTKSHPVHGLEHKSTIRIILIRGYNSIRRIGVPVGHWIKHTIEKYKSKYPEFAAKSTKKMLSAVKPNPQNGEHIQKIFNSLAENLSANR
jgi:hypothetical protein